MYSRGILVSRLTQYDIKQSGKKGYNKYALPQYFQALDRVDECIKAGNTEREAILKCFNGRLADILLVAMGEVKQTKEEYMRGY